MPVHIRQAPLLPRSARPIALIGAGGIAKDAHLPAYRKAGFPVVAIHDLDRRRAQALAERFGVPAVAATLEETAALAGGDAVFDVAVPAAATLDVLERLPEGAGVLIQKPMGETLEHARRIRDLCRSRRMVAAVNFQLRWAPNIIAARSLIDRGVIGELHDMEVRVTVYTPWHLWTFLEGIPRVEILYHSIHYLDLIRSFVGNPRGVYARTLRHPGAPKLASTRSSIILDYGDLLRAGVQTNHGHGFGRRHQESYVKWEGTKGAIVARLGLLLDYPEGEPDALEYAVLEGGSEPVWQTVPLMGSWFPDAFIGSMASLMRRLNGETEELPTSVEDALQTMAVAEACYDSDARGAIPVPGGEAPPA